MSAYTETYEEKANLDITNLDIKMKRKMYQSTVVVYFNNPSGILKYKSWRVTLRKSSSKSTLLAGLQKMERGQIKVHLHGNVLSIL